GVHVQITHRTLAVLLALHLVGVAMSLRKRRNGEAPVVVRAAMIALGLVMLQLVLASSMILLRLPPVLRSLHEATGVAIWLSCFAFAYLARRASGHPEGARLEPVPTGTAKGEIPPPRFARGRDDAQVGLRMTSNE
ncbi:MAG TPA: COX15/CtaA family protein, partial [Gemmatimonadaceae bacterium]